MVDWKVLSTDLKICYAIHEFNQIKKEKIWFSKLVRNLKSDASRSKISKILDKLFDLGIIYGKWEKADGKWTRVFKITGESEDFIKTVYENTDRPN